LARRRDERIDGAVLAAVLELAAEVGYSGLTMDAIASRAGTTKPAVRRRWPSQKHLVVAAIATRRPQAKEIDTGCTRCDLTGMLEALRTDLADPALARVLPALIADLADDPGLRERFLAEVWEPNRQSCRAALRRASQRGDFRPGLDPELVVDLFVSPVVMRSLFGHGDLGPDLAAQVTDAVLRGLGAPEHPADLGGQACRTL
jgi:AcrR family transcriptional regulator